MPPRDDEVTQYAEAFDAIGDGLLVVDPAATVAGVVVLMGMHVVAAVVIVAALTGRWR